MGRFPSSMQAPSWGPQQACRCESNSAEIFCAWKRSLTRIALVQQGGCFGARLFTHALLSGGMLIGPISCDCAHWQPALRQPLQCSCVWDPESLTRQRFPGEGVCCAGLKKHTGSVSVLQRYLSILVEKMETVHCAVDQGLHNALIYSGEQPLLHRYG